MDTIYQNKINKIKSIIWTSFTALNGDIESQRITRKMITREKKRAKPKVKKENNSIIQR